MSLQVLPIQAGGIALLILGVVLMFAEPFVMTGGILAGGGVVAFVLGLLWFLDPTQTDLRVSTEVWIPLSVGLATLVAFVGFAAARTARLSKETLKKIGGSSMSGLSGYQGTVEQVGVNGKKGKVMLRGELWDFESKNSLSNGDLVQVKRVVGLKIIVAPAVKTKEGNV